MKRYTCMTREQLHDLQKVSPPLPMPNGFTGLWRGVQFYKGKQWFGPTNLVGARVFGRAKMLTNPAHD